MLVAMVAHSLGSLLPWLMSLYEETVFIGCCNHKRRLYCCPWSPWFLWYPGILWLHLWRGCESIVSRVSNTRIFPSQNSFLKWMLSPPSTLSSYSIIAGFIIMMFLLTWWRLQVGFSSCIMPNTYISLQGVYFCIYLHIHLIWTQLRSCSAHVSSV